ncbi:hypothetical protein Htur_5061 (plasmid) [Haloterrigena turkmenica DSM 5511]|uniref:Uncharacterized protein n=1 Tax=Haloterrigena turkmenica (strain ATCC 51198 / DSM 5511 / JCM 9101 / NCIMB 13204 / VKM B-1734 / 4k) TaxID=543526 RepID=D2S3K1_HALTV|nr:hypothetical protein [Haloterrigena turkmenica]ADB63948.1 hypothetical protein Htur_5061 [Haloterrigena turkmenica DSM 5511]
MSSDLLHDRTGAAFAFGIVGAAFGGSAVGAALADLGFYDVSNPYFTAVVGGACIVFVAVLAGWYLPSAETVARQWHEHQALEERDSE